MHSTAFDSHVWSVSYEIIYLYFKTGNRSSEKKLAQNSESAGRTGIGTCFQV